MRINKPSPECIGAEIIDIDVTSVTEEQTNNI